MENGEGKCGLQDGVRPAALTLATEGPLCLPSKRVLPRPVPPPWACRGALRLVATRAAEAGGGQEPRRLAHARAPRREAHPRRTSSAVVTKIKISPVLALAAPLSRLGLRRASTGRLMR